MPWFLTYAHWHMPQGPCTHPRTHSHTHSHTDMQASYPFAQGLCPGLCPSLSRLTPPTHLSLLSPDFSGHPPYVAALLYLSQRILQELTAWGHCPWGQQAVENHRYPQSPHGAKKTWLINTCYRTDRNTFPMIFLVSTDRTIWQLRKAARAWSSVTICCRSSQEQGNSFSHTRLQL